MGFARRLLAFCRFAGLATFRATRMNGDVIFATSTPLTIAIPALLASWIRGIPFVFEVRDMWPDVPIAMGTIRNPILVWLSRRLELLTYRRAAYVVALAPGMREDIIAKGVASEKVGVIPNGCDIDVFSPAPADKSHREEFAWLGSRKLVLYAGAIGLVNGVDYFVDLAREVRLSDPDIRFVVVGGGREAEVVKDRAARAEVLGQNFFMFPAVSKRKLGRWLHDANLVCALIRGPRVLWKDAVQNKFFDALAAEKPIACNFDGWQSRLALEANVGITLSPTDIQAAAQQLTAALRDGEWLDGVPLRAREIAKGRFNRDRLAVELEQALSAVVKNAH
jgi:glycosyltransferase involved in cell wall biosynthesis